MKNYTILIGAVAVLIVGAVWAMSARVAKAPEGATTTATTTASGTATIATGKSATVNGIIITVLGLAEDSRCPVDVQCIQAGTVRVRVSMDVRNTEFVFTLGQPQIVENWTITLAAVVPAQKSSKVTVQPSDYRFTFSVVSK